MHQSLRVRPAPGGTQRGKPHRQAKPQFVLASQVGYIWDIRELRELCLAASGPFTSSVLVEGLRRCAEKPEGASGKCSGCQRSRGVLQGCRCKAASPSSVLPKMRAL